MFFPNIVAILVGSSSLSHISDISRRENIPRVRLNFNLVCFRFLRFVSPFGVLCPPLLGFVPFLAFLFVFESGLACPPELQFGLFLEVCLPIWPRKKPA